MARTFVASSSQYIDCGNITALNSASEFTIGGWFKRTASGKNSILGKRLSTTNQLFINVNTDGNVYCSVRNGGTKNEVFSNSTTDWLHVIMVFDGSLSEPDRIKVYTGGSPQSTTPGGGSHPTISGSYTNSYRLGALHTAVYSDGSQAEQKAWSVALTAAEVYQNFYGKTPRADKLLLYAPLGYGSPEPDLSGSGNNGVVTNSATIGDHPPIQAPWGVDAEYCLYEAAAAAGNPYYYYLQQQLLAG
tara:strand:- start:525 stop:1262 length:738 start_codon:yes stop_codon:yes gene_type:complete